jgi:hypothetical protein
MPDLLIEKLKSLTTIVSCRKRVTDIIVHTTMLQKMWGDAMSINHTAKISTKYTTEESEIYQL